MPVTLNGTQLLVLKEDLVSGPLAAQAEPYLRSNSPAIAVLYNTVGNEKILLPTVSRGQFLLGILPVGEKLYPHDDSPSPLAQARQDRWKFYLDIVKANDTITLSDPTVQTLLALLVTEELMTSEQVDAFSKRFCTHAEALFGSDVVLHSDDIQAASEMI